MPILAAAEQPAVPVRSRASHALELPVGARAIRRDLGKAQPQSALAHCLGGCKVVFPPCIVYYFGNYMPSDGDLHAAKMFHPYCEFALNPPVTLYKH